jgi:hypothetical protein
MPAVSLDKHETVDQAIGVHKKPAWALNPSYSAFSGRDLFEQPHIK